MADQYAPTIRDRYHARDLPMHQVLPDDNPRQRRSRLSSMLISERMFYGGDSAMPIGSYVPRNPKLECVRHHIYWFMLVSMIR
jgi:hypothetical protein